MPRPSFTVQPSYGAELQKLPLFVKLAQSATVAGIEAYVVGGYVRDLVLGRPVKDVDIVCLGDGAGLELAQHFAAQHPGSSRVVFYKNFGTASLHYDGYDVEFVGARRESYRHDSRKPIVENGTIAEDQARRDFTINAMSISLGASNFGELIDPFEGVEHLRQGLIKTPLDPDVTFSDDPLRMLRAIRFAARLGFDIDADTFAAIINNAERIRIVSAERIIDEINKIVMTAKPSYGFKLLLISKLLDIIFPELVALQGAENIEGKSHKDNFYHTLEVLDNVCQQSDDLWLRWAAILHDIAKPATKRYVPGHGFTFHGHEEKGARMVPGIFKRLKLPMHEPMRFVQKLVRMHLRPIGLGKEAVTDSAIRRIMVDAGDDIEALMILCKSDVTTKNPNKARRIIQNFEKVVEKMALVQDADALRNFQPVITGQHIMLAFDIPPSPIIGPIKTGVRELILDCVIPNELGPAYQAMLEIAAKEGLIPKRSFDEVMALDKLALAAEAAAKSPTLVS